MNVQNLHIAAAQVPPTGKLSFHAREYNQATVDGSEELPISANEISYKASQSSSADILTNKRGSYCMLSPRLAALAMRRSSGCNRRWAIHTSIVSANGM